MSIICFGINYSDTEPECLGCPGRMLCKQKFLSQSTTPILPKKSLPELDVNPFDYLMNSLDGKFEKEESSNDSANWTFFKNDGMVVIQVITSAKTGRVKIISSVFERIFSSKDSIKSIEEAEEILSRIFSK